MYASEDEKVTIDNEGKLVITAPDGTISATGGPGGTVEPTPVEAAVEEPEAEKEPVDEVMANEDNEDK